LPTAPGGLSLRAAPGAEAPAAQALEAAALDMLLHTPWRQLSVQVFDFGIRKRFPALAQLQPLGLYRIFQDMTEAQKGLAELERLARHRHHQLLDDETPTLADYNLTAPRPESYVLVVLNADDFPRDAGTTARLAALLKEAPAAGLHVLALSSDVPEASAPASSQPVPASITGTLAGLYPQLRVLSPLEPGHDAPMQLLGGPGTHALAELMARHGLSLTLPLVPLGTQVQDLRERAHAEEAGSDVQDFLRVQVGTTLDGREPIFWCMGARSGCYNALMLGMPGSGKSTLLNNLIVGIAEQYTAQELRLYLMDYKDGVEFQTFDNHPNVERIFLDNEDTAAATQLLQEFAATIHQRNELFKGLHSNVRNLDDHNRLRPDNRLPRILLVVDEAQRLLADTNRQSQRFADLLVDVTRRGRSAGVHIVLSTQSLGGVAEVGRLLAAISLRASFMLNSLQDAERVLEAGNHAPTALRKFECVLNADSGRKAANLLGLGLPTPDVVARLAAVRAQRPAHLCTTPVVAHSPGVAPAQTTVTAPPAMKGLQPSPSPAWTPPLPSPPTLNTLPPSADKSVDYSAEDGVLERARRRGIVPRIPPATS